VLQQVNLLCNVCSLCTGFCCLHCLQQIAKDNSKTKNRVLQQCVLERPQASTAPQGSCPHCLQQTKAQNMWHTNTCRRQLHFPEAVATACSRHGPVPEQRAQMCCALDLPAAETQLHASAYCCTHSQAAVTSHCWCCECCCSPPVTASTSAACAASIQLYQRGLMLPVLLQPTCIYQCGQCRAAVALDQLSGVMRLPKLLVILTCMLQQT
jgi:hypothetical protein